MASGGQRQRSCSDQDFLEEDELVTANSFSDSDCGTVLALQDRNSLAEDWPGRRVFVVMGVTSACILDENGTPIDEQDEFEGLSSSTSSSWVCRRKMRSRGGSSCRSAWAARRT